MTEFVCTRGTLNGPPEGKVVARGDPDLERWPELFVPVNRNRLAPDEALRATSSMTRTDAEGTRTVHVGTWVRHSDELVSINPESFEAVTA